MSAQLQTLTKTDKTIWNNSLNKFNMFLKFGSRWRCVKLHKGPKVFISRHPADGSTLWVLIYLFYKIFILRIGLDSIKNMYQSGKGVAPLHDFHIKSSGELAHIYIPFPEEKMQIADVCINIGSNISFKRELSLTRIWISISAPWAILGEEWNICVKATLLIWQQPTLQQPTLPNSSNQTVLLFRRSLLLHETPDES